MSARKTEHLQLPLPDPQGRLSEDVYRLRDSLILLDRIIHMMRTSVDSQIEEHSNAADVRIREMLATASEQLNTKLTTAQENVDSLIAEFEGRAEARLAGVTNNSYVPLPAPGEPALGEDEFCLMPGVASDDSADVVGLGRFIWSENSTAPIERGTCLLGKGRTEDQPGRWLLVQPSWDAILSELLWMDDWHRYRRRKDNARFDAQIGQTRLLLDEVAERSRIVLVTGHIAGGLASYRQWKSVGSFEVEQDMPGALCVHVRSLLPDVLFRGQIGGRTVTVWATAINNGNITIPGGDCSLVFAVPGEK